MNAAYKHIRSLAVQASVVAVFLGATTSQAQTAPEFLSPSSATARTKPSAGCQKAQQTVNKEGLGKYTLSDLTSHPALAGENVEISITVKDALGRAATSEKCAIVIPRIDFRHPVSVAMADLRRTLAQDSRKAGNVAQRFGKLLQDKANTIPNPATMDMLKAIQANLSSAKDTEALETVVRDMWEAMQRLEQENMSEAERRLSEMEKALREALEKGASEEEIRRLTEESMKAMQEALKEQSAKAGQNEKSKKDFDDLQKKIEEMHKMLEQLQQMDPKVAQKMQEMMRQM